MRVGQLRVLWLLMAMPIMSRVAYAQPITDENHLAQPRAVHQTSSPDFNTACTVRGIRAAPRKAGRRLRSELKRLPSVYIGNSRKGASRPDVSIRGFMADAGSGVRVMVNGIPESLNDGDTLSSLMNSAAVQQVIIRQGPDTSERGSAGGAIDITTRAPADGPCDEATLSAGSYGDRQISLSSAHHYKKWGYAGTASQTYQQGYRQHSTFIDNQLIGRFERDVGDTGQLQIVTHLIDMPDTQEPGGLTRVAAARHPKAANPGNVALDARQSATQETIGAFYRDRFDKQQTFMARAFYTHRDFTAYLPSVNSGVVTYRRNFFGGGLQSTRLADWFGHRNQTVFGIDFESQRDDRQNYDNDSGRRGALALHHYETAISTRVFVENTFSIRPSLALDTGLRYDWLQYDVDEYKTC